jgi:hypothetical protein
MIASLAGRDHVKASGSPDRPVVGTPELGELFRIGAVEFGTECGPCEAPRTPRNSSRVGVTLVG